MGVTAHVSVQRWGCILIVTARVSVQRREINNARADAAAKEKGTRNAEGRCEARRRGGHFWSNPDARKSRMPEWPATWNDDAKPSAANDNRHDRRRKASGQGATEPGNNKYLTYDNKIYDSRRNGAKQKKP